MTQRTIAVDCEPTCMATTQAGRRCRREVTTTTDGWATCSDPLHIEQGPPADHVGAAAEHLADAMRHEAWRQVPGPIRHLIEWASVDLQRALGDL